jgi:hypothetical protein
MSKYRLRGPDLVVKKDISDNSKQPQKKFGVLPWHWCRYTCPFHKIVLWWLLVHWGCQFYRLCSLDEVTDHRLLLISDLFLQFCVVAKVAMI